MAIKAIKRFISPWCELMQITGLIIAFLALARPPAALQPRANLSVLQTQVTLDEKASRPA